MTLLITGASIAVVLVIALGVWSCRAVRPVVVAFRAGLALGRMRGADKIRSQKAQLTALIRVADRMVSERDEEIAFLRERASAPA